LSIEGVAVDIISVVGADLYASPEVTSPAKQAALLMNGVIKPSEPLFESAELACNMVVGWRVLSYMRRHWGRKLICERYALLMFMPVSVSVVRLHRLDGHVVCGYLAAFVTCPAIDQSVIASQTASTKRLIMLQPAGDDVTVAEMQALAKQCGLEDRVVLGGRVRRDEVLGLSVAMGTWRSFPSSRDCASPVKLFEFIACGAPPIAPDFLPIREVLVGRVGWIFPAGSLDSAASAVLQRSRDKEELASVGGAARACVAAECQWSSNVAQLVDICRVPSKRESS
jgi:hypothetical protein